MGLWPIVGALLGVVVYQLLRRPVLRRLSLRETSRRPGETILVIAGSLLGTAIMTGSFIVGDTLDSSIRITATTQLGPVDEAILVPDAGLAAEVAGTIRDAGIDDVDGVIAIVSAPASVYVDGDDPLSEPSSRLVELDFEDARSFGEDPAATGIEGPTPEAGSVVITEDLAEVLEAEPGDSVTVSLYGAEESLEIDRILPRLGLAGFWTGVQTTSPNAFVAPGTIADLQQRGGEPGIPPDNLVLISNRGDVETGALLTDRVTTQIKEALGPTGSELRVDPLKQQRLDNAQEQGDQFAEFFLAIGSFAVMAGILLLVQIFVMLSEERKSQLGMLRAVGMRRADLIRSFYMQGGLYAVPAGLLGTLLGVGVGWAIVKVAAPIFGGFGDFSIEFKFAMELESLLVGMSLGILVSLITVFLTSFRISRINIIRAIRDLPEPKRTEPRTRTIVAGLIVSLAGVAAAVAGFNDSSAWVGILIGVPLALFGLLPLLSRFLPRRPTVIVVAALSLAWGVFGNAISGGRVFESGDIFAFVLQGLLLNISAVVLLTQLQENLEGALHRIAPRSISLRLGMAYPLARRFRTGLTLGMFSLVIFTMVFISVLSNVFGGQVENTLAREAGGFDVLASSLPTDAPDASEIADTEGVGTVSVLLYGGARFAVPALDEPTGWPVTGIDDVFVDEGPPALDEIDPSIGSEEEAWALLLQDPTTTIVPVFFLNEGGGGPPADYAPVGGEVTIIDPLTGTSEERTVIGHTSNDFAFSGAYMSAESLERVMGDAVAPSRFYIATDDGADPAAVAEELQGRFLANGMEASSFRQIVEEFQASNLQFFRLMQGYLALGLLVGIAGIGVVMVRAVRERRREVGVLRSLGFLPQMVRRAFIFESAFTAFEGILVGSVLALITANQLVTTGEFGEGIFFEIPWRDLSILVVTAMVASLAATAWPARQAARIPPAVALRISD